MASRPLLYIHLTLPQWDAASLETTGIGHSDVPSEFVLLQIFLRINPDREKSRNSKRIV